MMLKKIVLFLFIFISCNSFALTKEQQTYLDARDFVLKKDFKSFYELRNKIKNYPLISFLDYEAEIESIITLPGDKALKKLDKFKGTFSYDKGIRKYLYQAAKDKRFKDFLLVSPLEPSIVELQCTYYLAKLNKKEDISSARKLWLHGKSRPNSCDPLFNAMKKKGIITQELIWDRAILAALNNQISLVNSLTKSLKDKKTANLLSLVAKDPLKIKKHTFKTKKEKEVLAVGLQLLTKQKLSSAIELYNKMHKSLEIPEQKKVKYQIAYRALVNQNLSYLSIVDSYLPEVRDDSLVERRLRIAIAQDNKKDYLNIEKLLSKEGQEKDNWIYWHSRYSKNKEGLNKISNNRSFYGFIASHILNKKININDKTISIDNAYIAKIKNDPKIEMIKEFRSLEQYSNSYAQWNSILKEKTAQEQRQYSYYALNNQWYDLTVNATIYGKLWDDLKLRFPKAYIDDFSLNAKKYGVPIEELLAISRRESAFYHYATSPVGAMGLMQLMPATAKETAKKNNISPYIAKAELYNPSYNINLGTLYYKELKGRYDGNRILAIASYNAGPGRVRKWLDKSAGNLDYIAFIETIPFTETREYVQAVTTYRVLFQLLDKKKLDFISKKESSFRY